MLSLSAVSQALCKHIWVSRSARILEQSSKQKYLKEGMPKLVFSLKNKAFQAFSSFSRRGLLGFILAASRRQKVGHCSHLAWRCGGRRRGQKCCLGWRPWLQSGSIPGASGRPVVRFLVVVAGRPSWPLVRFLAVLAGRPAWPSLRLCRSVSRDRTGYLRVLRFM